MTSQNAVLDRLPEAVRSRLLATGQQVQLGKGEVLSSPGSALRHVYFPTAGLISIAGITEDGGSVELTAVGQHGLLDLESFAAGERVPHQAVVQLQGTAIRVDLDVFRQALDSDVAAKQVLTACANTRSAELAIGVVCHCYHTVLQRLCRWLLTAVDHTGRDTIEITHASLGAILGVLRPVVTRATIELQDASAVRNRRGRITVLDRRMLERSTCECYRLLRPTQSDMHHVRDRSAPYGNDDDTVPRVADSSSL